MTLKELLAYAVVYVIVFGLPLLVLYGALT